MTRRLTLAETELTDEIRRRGWLTASTGSYRTGRGVEAPHGRGTQIKPPEPLMLWTPCWCESYERWVSEDDVAAGRTWQCANRDCHPPGEPRPITLNGGHSDVLIVYDEPGTKRRRPTEAFPGHGGVLRTRPAPTPPPTPRPEPFTQDRFPLDPEFAEALKITGANRYEGLIAARCAAAQAGFHGETARDTILWYARVLHGD